MSVKVKLIRVKADGEKVYGLRINHKGDRKTISVGSESAAKRLKPAIEAKIIAGDFGLLNAPVHTFSEVSARYLAMIEQIRAPRTYSRYSVLVSRLNSALGSKSIDSITRGEIKSFLLDYHRSGASRSSVELAHTVCSGVFGFALDDELIKDLPTRKILSRLDLAKDKKEIHPFSADEMSLILDNCDQAYRSFFLFIYHTGCRFGEAAAVEWKDVDWRKKTIRIDKTAKDQHVRMSTKTYIKRDVDISDELLHDMQQLQRDDREWCFSKKRQQKHVFHFAGRLIPQQTALRKIKAACRKVGVRERTVHDIRHTTASMLLSRGAPLTYVSKLLGHSSPRITLDVYSHYMPSENKGAVNILSENSNSNRSAM